MKKRTDIPNPDALRALAGVMRSEGIVRLRIDHTGSLELELHPDRVARSGVVPFPAARPGPAKNRDHASPSKPEKPQDPTLDLTVNGAPVTEDDLYRSSE